MQGDDRTVLRLLKRGRSALPARIPNRGSLLAFARTPRAIDRLLALGAAPELPDHWGATPMEAFSRFGKPGALLVEHLVKLGVSASADIYARLGNRRRLAALCQASPDILRSPAVMRGAVDFRRHALVRWLLQQSTNVNMRLGGEPDATALHAAAWNGDLRMVKLLLEHGADGTIRDRQYHATPIDWARTAIEVEDRAGCREVMDLLEQLNGAAARETEKPAPRTAWKPLMDAAFVGDVPTVRRLLKAGADPNVLSNSTFRHRPLHRVIEHKKTVPRTPEHEQVVRLLLAAGADPRLRALVTRTTALQLAAMQEPRFVSLLLPGSGPLDLFDACAVLDEPRVRALIGPDPSVARSVDQNGWSPLHQCAASALFRESREASQRQLRIAALLHEAGADSSATYLFPGDASPISVLYHAAGQHDNPALVELLLRVGANPDDNEGIWHASDEGHAAALDVFTRLLDPALLARIASKCVVAQLNFGHVRGIPWLLAHGADPNAIEPVTGDAALHAAARAGVDEATVRLLLKHGARPDLRNREGKTAEEVRRK